MKLNDYFKNQKVYVWKETFAIVKSKNILPNVFATIKDKREITVIIDQSKINIKDAIKIRKNYKILTFGMVLPFGLVGFLAKISKALAEENISIFAISAYSTDHILIRNKDLKNAVKKLKSLGFVMKNK